MSATRAAILKPSGENTITGAETAGVGPVQAETHVALVNPAQSYGTVASPAVDLQRRLRDQLDAASEPDLRKYPPAVTIAGVVLFCSAFWYGVYSLIQALI